MLHVEILHEGIVDAPNFFRPNANLMCFAEETVTVFVGGDISFIISSMRIDAHVIRNSVVVIVQGLIHAVDGRFGAFSPIGQAEILARVAVEMVFFPKFGVHVLIRIVEIFTLERSGFLELIGGHGQIDDQKKA